MAPIAKTTPKLPFDEAKFATMTEPFVVRIEKVKGQARTPIPLPPSEDPTLEPGTGWSRDNVRSIESWLVTEWAGGGLYDISITDSSAPTPITMKWAPWWDPQTYPEIIPPPLRDAARAQTNQPQQAQPQTFQVVRPMSAFPHGLPQGLPQQGQYPQPQPHYAQPYYPPPPQYQLPQPPPVGTPQWNAWRNEAEDRRREDEIRNLREREIQREREAMEAKHKAELDRERVANETRFAAHTQQMNELRTMIAALTQSLTQAQNAKPAGDSTELAMLKAQLEAEKREREAERRDAQMREAIKQTQEATQRQIDALMEQMKQQALLAREASHSRPDQLVMMMQEQSRLNADALKTMASESARALERVQNFMMTPQAMFDLAARQSQSMDGVTDKLSRTFGTVMDMQQRVIENAINLQPGGTSGIDLAREGIDKVTSLVERYTSTKSAEQRFAMDAQVKVAQAQAAAIAASQGIPSQTVHVPPAPQPQGQLAGAPVTNGAPTSAPVPPQAVNTNTRKSGDVERFGRTDKEWFGPLLPNVLELRAGVARFIESLEHVPPRLKDGEPDGIGPEQAAAAIIHAVGMCMQNGVAVDALTELLFADRFADFVHVVIPDAPPNYREDTTTALIELAQRLTAEGGGDETPSSEETPDDDEGATEDGDGDGDQQAAPVAPPPSKPASRPVRRVH